MARTFGALLAVGLPLAVLSVLAETMPRDCEIGSLLNETFDNTTVRKRIVAPRHSASAEAVACSRCLLDVYVFMGASVTGVDVDILIKNARRKGKLQGDLRPLEEVIDRHCRHRVQSRTP